MGRGHGLYEYIKSLIDSGSTPVHLSCSGTTCAQCMLSDVPYRVCPMCGRQLSSTEFPCYVCDCGTYISMCGQATTVDEYVIPPPNGQTKDDTV